MIRRCVAFVDAHISLIMLRFPIRRTLWLTACCIFFNTLLGPMLPITTIWASLSQMGRTDSSSEDGLEIGTF
jgi:hypothetical protein